MHGLIELMQHRGPMRVFFDQPGTVWELSKFPIVAAASIMWMDIAATIISKVCSKTTKLKKAFHDLIKLIGPPALTVLIGSLIAYVSSAIEFQIALPSGSKDIALTSAVGLIAMSKLAFETWKYFSSDAASSFLNVRSLFKGVLLLSFLRLLPPSLASLAASWNSRSSGGLNVDLSALSNIAASPAIDDALMAFVYVISFKALQSVVESILLVVAI